MNFPGLEWGVIVDRFDVQTYFDSLPYGKGNSVDDPELPILKDKRFCSWIESWFSPNELEVLKGVFPDEVGWIYVVEVKRNETTLRLIKTVTRFTNGKKIGDKVRVKIPRSG